MNPVLITYVGLTLIAALASLILARLSFKHRVPGSRTFTVMMLANAWWCFSYGVELLVGSFSAQLFWAKLTYVGVVVVTPTWLIFALQYSAALRRVDRWFVGLFFLIPVATLLAVFFGGPWGLIWASAYPVTIAGIDTFYVNHGPWFWVHTVYSYACLLFGSLILLATVLTRVRRLTSQVVTVIVALSIPWLANVVSVVTAGPISAIDLTPPAVALSAAVVGIALGRFGMLKVFPGLVPVAHDAVMEGMRDGVVVIDGRGMVASANPAAEALFDGGVSPLGGRPASGLLAGLAAPEETKGESPTSDRTRDFETAVVDADGGRRYLHVVVSQLGASGQPSGTVAVMRDVTDRRELEDELKYQALHDALTELPNRALLRDQLRMLLELLGDTYKHVALLFFDLDRFKEVNDTFGHSAGDMVLRTMAQRLSEGRDKGDFVARLGGDEFAIVLPGRDADEAFAVALALRDTVIAPMLVHERLISVGTSVGIAVAPQHGANEDELIQHADVALYLAKAATRGVAVYDLERDPNSPERMVFVSELRRVVHERQLHLHYQPVVDAVSGEIHHAEALARWPLDSEHKFSGAEFIPLAEELGLMHEITSWALEEALAQCRRWQQQGWTTRVAVNLSTADLRDSALVGRVAEILQKAQVEPERLAIEVTETSAMTNPQRARTVLEALRELGVSVSIDDFGTGHSSLAYLRTLPATELKIDRSFVQDVLSEPADRAIVKAAINLGHDLDLHIVAEGVENDAVLAALRDLGCDYVQGYGIAKPMGPDDLLAWAQQKAVASPLRH